nr:uncharacterized protein LOC106781908 isoform X1 [Equus caballus]XP_023478100.1 uncharacterized protein LOC111768790 isoform X1 [Equus caballus]
MRSQRFPQGVVRERGRREPLLPRPAARGNGGPASAGRAARSPTLRPPLASRSRRRRGGSRAARGQEAPRARRRLLRWGRSRGIRDPGTTSPGRAATPNAGKRRHSSAGGDFIFITPERPTNHLPFHRCLRFLSLLRALGRSSRPSPAHRPPRRPSGSRGPRWGRRGGKALRGGLFGRPDCVAVDIISKDGTRRGVGGDGVCRDHVPSSRRPCTGGTQPDDTPRCHKDVNIPDTTVQLVRIGKGRHHARKQWLQQERDFPLQSRNRLTTGRRHVYKGPIRADRRMEQRGAWSPSLLDTNIPAPLLTVHFPT